VHFVHFAAFWLARWTLCPYSEHFVHLTKLGTPKWTKCTLTEAKLPTLPTQPQLTLTSPLTFVDSNKRPELDSNQRPTP
jgi:hypothetical protein